MHGTTVKILKYGPCVNMWKTGSAQIQGSRLSAQLHFIQWHLIFCGSSALN